METYWLYLMTTEGWVMIGDTNSWEWCWEWMEWGKAVGEQAVCLTITKL